MVSIHLWCCGDQVVWSLWIALTLRRELIRVVWIVSSMLVLRLLKIAWRIGTLDWEWIGERPRIFWTRLHWASRTWKSLKGLLVVSWSIDLSLSKILFSN